MGIPGLYGLLKFGQNDDIHRNVGCYWKSVWWRNKGNSRMEETWGGARCRYVSTDPNAGGKKQKKDSRESEALFLKTEQVPKSILVPTKKKNRNPLVTHSAVTSLSPTDSFHHLHEHVFQPPPNPRFQATYCDRSFPFTIFPFTIFPITILPLAFPLGLLSLVCCSFPFPALSRFSSPCTFSSIRACSSGR